jgi:hypothetical protein
VRHVARKGEKRCACKVLVGNMRITDHLEDRGIDGSILKLVFKNWDRKHGFD